MAKGKSGGGIAVEAFLLRNGHTGVEQYILNLARTLSRGSRFPVTLFILSECHYRHRPEAEFPNLTVKVFPIRGIILRVIFQHLLFPFWLNRFEKVFFTGYVGSLFFPARKSAVAVFDLIALSNPTLVKLRTRLYYRLFMPMFLRKAAFLVVPSEKVREQVLERKPQGRVLKLEIPVDESFYAPDGIAPRIDAGPSECAPILVVGFGEKKKNHHLLLEIAPRFPEHRFILIGHRTRKTVFPKNVSVTGFLPQDKLVAWFKVAGALAFLSWEEGYGLPIMEGLVSKIPVLCWKTPPFTEYVSPLLHFPDQPNLGSYIEKLEYLLTEPGTVPKSPHRLIRWPEYWDRLSSELMTGA